MNTMQIMFCINDPDNGMDTGKAHAFDFDLHMRLEGRDITVRRVSEYKLKIGRRQFNIERYRSWVGNWCWDCAEVNMTTANKIANYLRSTKQFDCIEGITRYYDMWHDQTKPIDFERIDDQQPADL